MFRQVLAIGNGVVLAEVTSSGTTEDPGLSLTLRSNRLVRSPHAHRAESQVASILSLSDDMAPFYRAVAGDPVLADLAVRLRGVRATVTPTLFEALTDSIIEQQISLKAARSIETRLIHAVGKQLDLKWHDLLWLPGPGDPCRHCR